MNTFEMHEEKIWAMDFCEHITDDRTSLKMITGSSDSKVKIWVDNTVEQVALEKQGKLDLIENEHVLSKLLRDNDLVQASLLAFKLNKLRDFFFAMDRLVSGKAPTPRPFIPGFALNGVQQQTLTKEQDPVESILLSQSSFEKVI